MPHDIHAAFEHLKSVIYDIVRPTLAATEEVTRLVREAERDSGLRDKSIPASVRGEKFRKMLSEIKPPQQEEIDRSVAALKGCIGEGVYHNGTFEITAKPIEHVVVIPHDKLKSYADTPIGIYHVQDDLYEHISAVWDKAANIEDYAYEDFCGELMKYGVPPTHHYEGVGHAGLDLANARYALHDRAAIALFTWMHESVH